MTHAEAYQERLKKGSSMLSRSQFKKVEYIFDVTRQDYFPKFTFFDGSSIVIYSFSNHITYTN